MNLVPEHINEAIKHMPGMSVEDFWNSLKKLNGKELAEALIQRLDMWPFETLDALLRFAPEEKISIKNVLDIIDNLRFSSVNDRLRNIEKRIDVVDLYAALFDSLEAEDKDNAIDLLRMHTEEE